MQQIPATQSLGFPQVRASPPSTGNIPLCHLLPMTSSWSLVKLLVLLSDSGAQTLPEAFRTLFDHCQGSDVDTKRNPGFEWRIAWPDNLYDEGCVFSLYFLSCFFFLRGKAGVDQWHGSEVASIPGGALEIFAEFMACCQRNGLVPSQWATLRQIHLPKPGKKVRRGGAKDVTGFRPIGVSSVRYRKRTLPRHGSHPWSRRRRVAD